MTTDVARDRETRPGKWVAAVLDARGINEAELAVLIKRAPGTVYRWKTEGLDYIVWIGVLALLELPLTWEPGDKAPPWENPLRAHSTTKGRSH